MWRVQRCPRLRSDEDRLAAVRLLLFAVPRGLSVAAIAELFRAELGIVAISHLDVEGMLGVPAPFLTTTLEGVSLHLSAGHQEPTGSPAVVDANLTATPDEEVRAQGNMHSGWSSTVPGKCTLKYRMMRDAIRSSTRNVEMTNSISVTGRVGRPVMDNESCTAAYLDLADEVRKTIAYELVAGGYTLVGVAGEEFVVEIPEGSPSALDDQVTAAAIAAAARLLGRLASDCWTSRRSMTWVPSEMHFRAPGSMPSED